MTLNIKSALKEAVFWLLANIVGMGTYFAIESWILAPRDEVDEINPMDVMYYWSKLDFPVLAVFLVLNFVWLISILMRRPSDSKRSALAVWLMVCLAWGVTLIIHGVAVIMLVLVIGIG